MLFNSSQKLSTIAKLIDADFNGDPDFPVTGINEIHRVKHGDLTFVDHPKYYDKALNSKASTILINKKIPCPDGKAFIYSDDPFRDFVKLIRNFNPFEPSSNMVSSTAAIEEGTIIQPGVFIGNKVKIGKNCLIHPNVSIYNNSIIGDNVIIHSGAVIGSDGFYFKRRPKYHDKLESGGKVIIEDYVEIGASCTIDRGITDATVIGWGTKMDNHIHVGHDTIIGKNCLFAAHVGISGCVNIEDDVVLWGQVGVQKDITIGEGAVVLGQSGVTKSIEGGKTYFGTPAQEGRKKMKEIAMLKNVTELYKKIQ